MELDFKTLFESMNEKIFANQRKIVSDSPIKLFYGLNKTGQMRLSFLSSISAFKVESTNLLQVTQGWENEHLFWTTIDLLDSSASEIFYAFCDDLVTNVAKGIDEKDSLTILKNRYFIWKQMFKVTQNYLSEEKVKGLFGELYIIKNILINELGVDNAIRSWVGPLGADKDFSFDKKWIETKSVSTKSQTITVASLEQLSSPTDGFLSVITLENMSETFDDGQSTIRQLITSIQTQIESSEVLELFFTRLKQSGFDSLLADTKLRFMVKGLDFYLVNDDFPRLKQKDIKFEEIVKVSYQIVLKSIERFKTEYVN